MQNVWKIYATMSIRHLEFDTQVFGVNVIDAVLNGTNYARSLKGYLILANAIEKLKWEAFSKHIDLHEFSEFSKALKAFQVALASKNPEESKSSYHVCLNQCQVIKQEFKELHHFTSGQLVDPEISAKILEFFDKGLTECLIFPEERYLQKSKKLGETIKRFKVPPFIPKNTTEKKDTSRVSAKNATKKIGETEEN